MIVAMTDGISGQLGTTLHTALLGMWMAHAEKKDSLVMSVQPGRHELEAYLTGRRRERWEEGNGIEALRKLVKAGLADREGVRECVTELGRHLNLLPERFYAADERTLRDYEEDMDGMMRELGKSYDYVFCDVGSERGGLAERVIESADMLVRGIGQNTAGLAKCFEESAGIYKDIPVFYLFGSYDSESKYNIHNLRHCFRELTAENCACMPYCTEIRDACLDGRLLEVFEKWRTHRAAKPLDKFFRALQETAGRLGEYGRGGSANEKIRQKTGNNRPADALCKGIY